MKRGVYMATETKPSLYEYYLKLVPDTVIFDEIERIACQNGIDCGSFDGRGNIRKNGDLFFYFDGSNTNLTKISTNAYRIFLKIYGMTKDTVTNYENYLNNLCENNSTIKINHIFMQDNLSAYPSNNDDVDVKYIVLDSSNIIALPLKYKKDDGNDYVDIFNEKCIIGVVF